MLLTLPRNYELTFTVMEEQKERNERKLDIRQRDTHLTNIHRQRHIDRSKDIAQNREMATNRKLGRPQK